MWFYVFFFFTMHINKDILLTDEHERFFLDRIFLDRCISKPIITNCIYETYFKTVRFHFRLRFAREIKIKIERIFSIGLHSRATYVLSRSCVSRGKYFRRAFFFVKDDFGRLSLSERGRRRSKKFRAKPECVLHTMERARASATSLKENDHGTRLASVDDDVT